MSSIFPNKLEVSLEVAAVNVSFPATVVTETVATSSVKLFNQPVAFVKSPLI